METKKSSWTWNGKILDCNGRVGLFYLNAPNDQGRADFLIELMERDGHPSQIKGSLKATRDEQKNLVLKYESSDAKNNDRQNFNWEAKLKQASPGLYAKECSFGTYEASNPEAHITNGVMVMWQFN